MGCFVAALAKWLLTRNRWYETVLLLLICFTLFRPGFWLDQMQSPFDTRPASDLATVAESVPQGLTLRFRVPSQSRAGEDVEKLVRLTMRGASGRERLQSAGIAVTSLGGDVTVQSVRFGSEAAKYGLAAGDKVSGVLVPANRPSRYWFAVPALLLLAAIVMLQLRRRRPQLALAH